MMKLLQVLIIFVTIGLTFARDFLATLGVGASYTTIVALGLALTSLLAYRGIFPIVAVLILTALVAIPANQLAAYSLDHDMLRAMAIVIMLYPWIRKIAADN